MYYLNGMIIFRQEFSPGEIKFIQWEHEITKYYRY